MYKRIALFVLMFVMFSLSANLSVKKAKTNDAEKAAVVRKRYLELAEKVRIAKLKVDTEWTPENNKAWLALIQEYAEFSRQHPEHHSPALDR